MSGKNVSISSTSTQSVKKQTQKTQLSTAGLGELPTGYGQTEAQLRSSNSPLDKVYKTDKFRSDWANDVRFHVARNLLYLRRHRRLSQAKVGIAVGTSQSAIARIESAQENITLDTLQRVVVALKGRFQISISPQEHSVQPGPPWWDTVNNPWVIRAWAARREGPANQVLVALEQTRDDWTTTNTTNPKGVGVLTAKTNEGEVWQG